MGGKSRDPTTIGWYTPPPRALLPLRLAWGMLWSGLRGVRATAAAPAVKSILMPSGRPRRLLSFRPIFGNWCSGICSYTDS